MRVLYLTFCLLIIACADQPKKKVVSPIEKEKTVIPDHLIGKDFDGEEILIGKVSLSQLSEFSASYPNQESSYF